MKNPRKQVPAGQTHETVIQAPPAAAERLKGKMERLKAANEATGALFRQAVQAAGDAAQAEVSLREAVVETGKELNLATPPENWVFDFNRMAFVRKR